MNHGFTGYKNPIPAFYSYHDPEFKEDAAQRKLDLAPSTGKELQAVVEEIFKTSTSVVER
jgi:hypothetical protein